MGQGASDSRRSSGPDRSSTGRTVGRVMRGRWYACRRASRNRRAPRRRRVEPARPGARLRPSGARPARTGASMDPTIAPPRRPDARGVPDRLDPDGGPGRPGSPAAPTRGRSGPGGPAAPTPCARSAASWAAVVVVGDLLKGIIPVLLARVVTGGDPLVEVLCGGAAVAGAIWSVFVGFRSGRGVGTGVGTMLVIQPVAVLLAAPVFVGRHPVDPLRVARVAAGVGGDVPRDAAGAAGRPRDAAPLRAVLGGRARHSSGWPTPTTSSACCTARSASSTWACSPGSGPADAGPGIERSGSADDPDRDHAGSAGRWSARAERSGGYPALAAEAVAAVDGLAARRAGTGPGPPCRRTSRWRSNISRGPRSREP